MVNQLIRISKDTNKRWSIQIKPRVWVLSSPCKACGERLSAPPTSLPLPGSSLALWCCRTSQGTCASRGTEPGRPSPSSGLRPAAASSPGPGPCLPGLSVPLLHLPPHLISLTSKCQSLLSQMCGNCLSSSGTSDSLWPPLSIATGLAVMRGTLLVSLALSVLPPGPPLLMAWALWRALKRPHAVSVPATSLPLLHACCPHTVGWAESRAFPAGLLIIGSFCSARLMGLSWS